MAGCGSPPTAVPPSNGPCAPAPSEAPASTLVADRAPIELVESAPIETVLDHADIPNASAVWLEMLHGATERIELAQFYLSSAPGSLLEPVIAAIEAAADRGVAVRLLVEQSFYARYPDVVDRLARRQGVAVRRLDLEATTGGILHAKYFLVDGREAYLGSQNFDWRSLGHIQEIGLRIRHEELVRSLEALFALDWARAGGEALTAAPPRGSNASYPLRIDHHGELLQVTPALSPTGLLPDESLWDLPQLVKRLDQARGSIHLQLLTYEPTMRDGSPFPTLDEALRRAAARGVEVRLLLADWCKRAGTVEPLQRLAELPHVEIRLATIPRWSGGFIPFARVIHAKYLVVDGAVAWVGTSNWSGDYFFKSRNVGLVIEGRGFAARLERVFRSGWDGPYVERLDPSRRYAPPRVEHE